MNAMLPIERTLWDHWIHPKYHQDRVLDEMATWFKARPRQALGLHGFLHPEKAHALASTFGRLDGWSHIRCRLGDSSELVEVDDGQWRDCPETERFSSQWIAQTLKNIGEDETILPRAERAMALHFLVFSILGPGLRSWLSYVVSSPLSETVTCELTRFGRGDFIASHTDALDARLLGINFYLDPDWQPVHGGALVYQNETGARTALEPIFNSVSLIPIDPMCSHQVEPWTHDETGRMTFCAAFRPAT